MLDYRVTHGPASGLHIGLSHAATEPGVAIAESAFVVIETVLARRMPSYHPNGHFGITRVECEIWRKILDDLRLLRSQVVAATSMHDPLFAQFAAGTYNVDRVLADFQEDFHATRLSVANMIDEVSAVTEKICDANSAIYVLGI